MIVMVELVMTESELQDSPTTNILDKHSRLINGFSVDTITRAPLQLIQYALLNTNQEKAFDLVSNHEGMAEFTISISKVEFDDSEAKSPCGEGTKRFCRTPVKFIIEEKIVCWQSPRMYGYSIQNCTLILPNHLGLVQLEPVTDETCILIWRTYFDGRRVGGVFARTALNTILPNLVHNMASHFNGKSLNVKEVMQLLPDALLEKV